MIMLAANGDENYENVRPCSDSRFLGRRRSNV